MPEPLPSTQPSRRALVVGIDDYPYVHALPLKGCRNDALRIGSLLGDRFGFEVRHLLDREATREALLEAMEELARDLGPEDRVLFHFSGHGSRIVDPSGQAVESLVPHDSGRGEYPNRDITDQELYGWLARLSEATPYVTLVMDSCHAGGIVRSLGPEGLETVRGIEADQRPGALAGKEAFPSSEGQGETLRGAARDLGASGWLPWSDRYTLIAACRAEESARELVDPETGDSHGALTYYLSESLLHAQGALSYRDLFEPVSSRIQARYREQRPQLEGAWDREVFGERLLAPMRFAPVHSRGGHQVELDAGAAHGLARGSMCSVFTHGTRAIEGIEPIGRIRIEEVQLLGARAELLEERAPGAVDRGSRAVEVSRPERAWRLAVRSSGPEGRLDQLRRRLATSPLLAHAASGDAPYAVHLLEQRRSVEAAVPVPQLGAVDWPLWAVVDASGRQVMAPRSASAPDALEQVVANLELWARYRALLELDRLSDPKLQRCPVTIELHRRPPGGSWSLAEPGLDGRRVLQAGERLGIRVRHGHGSPLHLAILDLGLTGAVHLLYPTRGRSRGTQALTQIEVGLDELAPLELFVPEELPYPGERFEEARETLIFLLSTEEADLSLLSQEGVRGVLGGTLRSDSLEQLPGTQTPGSLGQALRLAVTGQARRDARSRSEHPATAQSRVLTESFWLRRPS